MFLYIEAYKRLSRQVAYLISTLQILGGRWNTWLYIYIYTFYIKNHHIAIINQVIQFWEIIIIRLILIPSDMTLIHVLTTIHSISVSAQILISIILSDMNYIHIYDRPSNNSISFFLYNNSSRFATLTGAWITTLFLFKY